MGRSGRARPDPATPFPVAGLLGLLALLVALASVALGAPRLISLAAQTVALLAVGTLLSSALAQRHRLTRLHHDQARMARSRDGALALAQEERERLQHERAYLHTHDPLTGLVNRRRLLALLDQPQDEDRDATLLLVSLAGLTEINETRGSAVGDAMLVSVGHRLAEAVRAVDVVARVGGDVFAVLLDATTAEQAAGPTERLLAGLRGEHHIADQPLSVGVRGCYVACRRGRTSAGELLRRAERAVADAGAFGAPVLLTADDSGDRDRRALEADLRGALGRGELSLLYQPLVSATSGRIVGAEALLRWAHPSRGQVSPELFIPAAERSGLIGEIGLWVVEEATRTLRGWQKIRPDVHVAVNLSVRQLTAELVGSVRQLLWASGVNPNSLVLEVTETGLLDQAGEAVNVLWQLRGLGARLAMDDFGTGYSSLGRLAELPMDELKIDRSLVSRLGLSEPGSEAIIAAAVAMGHGLGLSVVAEGVETAEQAELAARHGVDLLQGWLCGRPMSAPSLLAALGSGSFDRRPVLAADPARAPAPEPVPAMLPSLAPATTHTVL